jgi:CBS domain-containing protein
VQRAAGATQKVIKKEEPMMLRAKDVMSTDFISVKQDDPIFEAVKLLVDNNISGLPVVDDEMILKGILSEKDVIHLFSEDQDIDDNTVADYMTQPAVFFDSKDALLNVCNFLSKNIFRIIPITSGGRLVGIISIRDVLKSVLNLRQEKAVTAN